MRRTRPFNYHVAGSLFFLSLSYSDYRIVWYYIEMQKCKWQKPAIKLHFIIFFLFSVIPISFFFLNAAIFYSIYSLLNSVDVPLRSRMCALFITNVFLCSYAIYVCHWCQFGRCNEMRHDSATVAMTVTVVVGDCMALASARIKAYADELHILYMNISYK